MDRLDTTGGKLKGGGYGCFRGALREESVPTSLSVAGDWVEKDRATQRGRSSRFLRFLVHTCTGWAQLSGHKPESGAGHC